MPTKHLSSGLRTDCKKYSIHLLRCLLSTFVIALCSVVTAKADMLTWNANGGAGPSDGSGDWLGAGLWWNGASATSWVDGSGATFGSGAGSPGTYTVTVSSPVAATNVTFSSPGNYILTGTQISITNSLRVNPGVTAQIDSFIFHPNVSVLYTNYNLLILGGGGQRPVTIIGGTPAANPENITATNRFTGGSWTGNTGTYDVKQAVQEMQGGTLFAGTRSDIGVSTAGAGILNVYSGAQYHVNSTDGNNDNNNLQICRQNGPGIVNAYNGSLITTYSTGVKSGGNFTLVPDSDNKGTLNIFPGATINVGLGQNGTPGVSSTSLRAIRMLTGARTYNSAASAIINMSGGVMAAENIIFGNSGGTYTANPTNVFNMTGGTLYLDNLNMSQAKDTGTNFQINLSGGTIAATASWSPACALPLNLNGNITFQAADVNSTPFNIALAGTLSGTGGLTKTGGGILTLSGANTFSGPILASEGTLTIETASPATNGSVTLSGSAINSIELGAAGQYWTVGSLTYSAGTPTADFSFDIVTPSTTVAPIQVEGNLAFPVTPLITVEGTAIPSGQYPLIKYEGTLSGTPPTGIVALPPSAISAFISNNIANKSIDLVITSTFSPVISWAVGDGVWDIDTTANWDQSGSPVNYTEGSAVKFDDTASGTSPITITLNTTVNPLSVAAFNTAKQFIISGSGAIAGSAGLAVSGGGTLTLAGDNTYTGGTTINSGQVDINNGGNGTSSSSIGSGPLTINLGGKINNSSGSAVTLATPIAQLWNDDFTFVGSQNLNLGSGQVTLGSSIVTVTVNSNSLIVNNPITDNAQNYSLAKSGSGTLTLSNFNNYGGGFILNAGQVNMDTDGAFGSGPLIINGGTIDNTSGSTRTLPGNPLTFVGDFAFKGSGNLDLGAGAIGMNSPGGGFLTVTVVSNTLSTEGALTGGNRTIIKEGLGTLRLGGDLNDNNGLGLLANAGVVELAKNSSGINHAIGTWGLTVNTNGTVIITGTGGDQINDSCPIALNGGVLDVNGNDETFNFLNITNGTLRNGAALSCAVRDHGLGNIILAGDHSTFDVAAGGTLTVRNIIIGTGALVKTGEGTLNFWSNNTYTASTVIKQGTFALTEPAMIPNSQKITVEAGATFSVAARTDATLTLSTGQTLSGSGTVDGSLIAPSGSTVVPGPVDAIGTLSVTTNIGLDGNLFLKVNRTNAQTSDKLLALNGTINYGGTLVVSNSGPALQVGDTFQLFPTAVTGFTAIDLSSPDANGFVYTWDNKVAMDGSIQVTAVGSVVNTTPTNLVVTASSGSLTFTWPDDYLGWELQVQTNSIGVGIGTNWVTIPGTDLVTSTNIAIDTAAGTVFYRMVYQ